MMRQWMYIMYRIKSRLVYANTLFSVWKPTKAVRALLQTR